MSSRFNLLLIALLTAMITSCSDTTAPSASSKDAQKKETQEAKLVELTRKAEAGNTLAQFDLGMIYDKGEGMPTDSAKAAEWFQKAAAQGNAKAQAKLGKMYRDGEGVRQDYLKAVEWLQKAADQGIVEAQAYLGMMYRRGDGVHKDDAKGAKLCRKAAEQGNAFAQHCLGSAYQHGKGVRKDTAIAMELYLKASAQGEPNSSAAIGLMYDDGEGVPKDRAKAIEWYEKAADQGDAWAQYMLGLIYERGNDVPRDVAKAVDWYRKAAAQGDTSAQVNIALMYARGEGVPRDYVLAYAWINIAASSEFAPQEAVSKRSRIEAWLTRAQIAEAQGLSSGWKKGQVLAREGKGAGGWMLRKRSTGTLFIVSTAGQAVTNQHVIENCKEVRLEGRDGVAKVVTEDMTNDLALVQVSGLINSSAPIVSEPRALRQGEDIVVFGFPLNSVLSSGGNLTPGVVSALTGLGNNTNQIQISAPIQPGSSGSPVMNKYGEVIGVVSMKLSDAKMAAATGSVGQNVSFAVSGQTLRAFLDAHQVAYGSSGNRWFSREKKVADIGDEARKWTFVVECWK